MTKVMLHIIGVGKKADSQKWVREAKSLGNPALRSLSLSLMYKAFLRPFLIYASSGWFPFLIVLPT